MDAQPPTDQSRLNQQLPPHGPQPAATGPHAVQDEAALSGAPQQDGAAAQQESVFAAERYSFSTHRPRSADVAHTFDTATIASTSDHSTQALIDSVPWSSVPTALDPTTVDSLPDKIRTVIEDEHLMTPEGATSPSGAGGPASPRDTSRQTSHETLDLLDPSGVPTPPPSTSTGSAPSEPSPAVTAPPPRPRPASAAPASSPAPAMPYSPGSPATASQQAVRRPVPSTIEVPALQSSQPAPAAAPAGRSTDQQETDQQEPVPAMPPAAPGSERSTGALGPSLSVRLVPLLGGEPIVIHEPTVIGRDPDNISSYPGAERVSLTDPTRSVSKTHAAIFPLLDGVWVTDLHSTNGSRVEHKDGTTVQAVPDVALAAMEGTTVFLGRIGFRIEVVG